MHQLIVSDIERFIKCPPRAIPELGANNSQILIEDTADYSESKATPQKHDLSGQTFGEKSPNMTFNFIKNLCKSTKLPDTTF